MDRSDLAKLNTPKLRNRTSTTPRPRPKTIHVESGGMEDGMLTPSRGKKGSTTNLAGESLLKPFCVGIFPPLPFLLNVGFNFFCVLCLFFWAGFQKGFYFSYPKNLLFFLILKSRTKGCRIFVYVKCRTNT